VSNLPWKRLKQAMVGKAPFPWLKLKGAWLNGRLTVHFVKKHYLQCSLGEVTKTFSQLGVLHVSVGGISKSSIL